MPQKGAALVRSPLHSEQEAFGFVLLLMLAVTAVALAAVLGPTWLAPVVLAVMLGAVAVRVARLRVRKLRGLELPVKMAPAHADRAMDTLEATAVFYFAAPFIPKRCRENFLGIIICWKCATDRSQHRMLDARRLKPQHALLYR